VGTVDGPSHRLYIIAVLETVLRDLEVSLSDPSSAIWRADYQPPTAAECVGVMV
jgi:hypothetical protein